MAWSAVESQQRVIYPIRYEEFVVPDFAIPAHWPRAYGLEIRWQTGAAIWGAHDPESDTVYLYGEYCEEGQSVVHAAAIQERGEWIPGLIEATSNGRQQIDGDHLIQTYRRLGLRLRSIENPLESGILNVWERMSTGRLKAFASLTKYVEELRLYRRDAQGQIVREQDILQDALRCLLNGVCRMCTQPVKRTYNPEQYMRPYGERSWMA
jgi:hypothetical protein